MRVALAAVGGVLLLLSTVSAWAAGPAPARLSPEARDRFAAALSAYRAQDWAQAARELAEISRTASPIAEYALLYQAESLARLGDVSGARAAAQQAVDSAPDSRAAPPALLLVVGAGHVAMPLTSLARTLGYRTVVVDGRPRFATAERFPDVDELKIGIPSELVRDYPFIPSTALVLVAHDYKYDLPVLRHALATDVGYIGMLGSSRRGGTILRYLAEEGVDEATLSRVRVPIGLDDRHGPVLLDLKELKRDTELAASLERSTPPSRTGEVFFQFALVRGQSPVGALEADGTGFGAQVAWIGTYGLLSGQPGVEL